MIVFDNIEKIKLNKKLVDSIIQEYKKNEIEVKEDVLINNSSCILLTAKEKAVKLHNYLGYLCQIETWISLNEFYWQESCKSLKNNNKEFNVSQNAFLEMLKDMLENYLFLNKKLQEFILIHDIPLTHYEFLKPKYYNEYKKYSNIKKELKKTIS